ncbi:MAG: hypothetical protein D6767_07165 [Candidatus Hydrogenedentota bacterium]|nr:MAG: hypothetical protein D6767_07165 [Candidatus Hydrogenedentota bacterium]
MSNENLVREGIMPRIWLRYLATILAGFFVTYLFVISLLRIAELRLEQLQALIESQANSVLQSRSLALMARYKFIRKERVGIYGEEDLLNEARLTAIIEQDLQKESKSHLTKTTWFDGFLLTFIHFFSAGEEREVTSVYSEKLEKLLQLAFYYETERKFAKAIAAYHLALQETDRDTREYFYILLHRGFCYMILGKEKEAKADLLAIIKTKKAKDAFSEYYTNAKELYASLSKKRKGVGLKQKAFQAFSSLNFLKSIDLFSRMLDKKPSSLSYFYRGRSFEELGIRSAAIHDYKQAIRINHPKRYAMLANRRLYMLGLVYTSDKKLKQKLLEESKKIAKHQKDKLLVSNTTTRKLKQIQNVLPNNKSIPLDESLEKQIDTELKKQQTKLQIKPITAERVTQHIDEGKKFPKKHKTKKRIVKVKTITQEIFRGELIKETKKELWIHTRFGRIVIPQKDILEKKYQTSK